MMIASVIQQIITHRSSRAPGPVALKTKDLQKTTSPEAYQDYEPGEATEKKLHQHAAATWIQIGVHRSLAPEQHDEQQHQYF